MRSDVAALYVDARGVYPRLVEHWWDERRDARMYAGPWPIVAHPPCGVWGRIAHLSKRCAADRELAMRAVLQVRAFGGVLEHPAWSTLFYELRLPRPGELGDAYGGFTVEVCQSDFGHVARKRSWLYVVGVPRSAVWPLPPRREPTHWCSGGRTRRPGMGSTVPAGIKVCSAQQRRRTPEPFARWLIELAASARPLEARRAG